MNVNLNTIHQTGVPALPAEPAQVERKRQTEQAAALSVSHADASPEEVAGAEVSEKSLVRDDPLGQLVASAFNLPPPSFPPLPTG